MGRTQPRLIDGDRLLDRRQRLGKALRAQQQIGELGEAARGLDAGDAVVLLVARERGAQHPFGVGEAVLGRVDRAQRAQRLARRHRRPAVGDRDRALPPAFGGRQVAAGQGNPGEPGQRSGERRAVGAEPRFERRHRGDQQRLGIEVAMPQQLELGQRDHGVGRVRRAAAVGRGRDLQRPPPRGGRLGQRAAVDLRAGEPVEQRQQMRARRAAAAFFDRQRLAQPGDRARVGRAACGAPAPAIPASRPRPTTPQRDRNFRYSRTAHRRRLSPGNRLCGCSSPGKSIPKAD